MRVLYPFRLYRISKAGLPVLACAAFTLLPVPQAQSAVLSDTVATQIPGRDLRVNPPAIASLTITPLGGVGALEKGLLEVRFKESGLPSSLQILHKGSLKTLRDDGTGDDGAQDGVYSALLDFKLGEMLEHQTKLRESGQAQSLSSRTAAAAPLVVSPLSVSTDLDPDKTLFIRDTSVVNSPSRTSDPCTSSSSTDAKKKWTFGYLMTQIANQTKTGRSPSDLAMSLLKQWETERIINDDVVPARPLIRDLVINPWLNASGNTGKLAMHKAPFRLLGIVNRIDLRQNLFFGEGLAGELRFVWGVLNLNSKAADGSCNQFGSFTLIMEYAVDKKTPAEVKAYGQKWMDLNSMTLNSGLYRESLQGITESVVKAGAGAVKGRANGSALIRIRTNEIELRGGPWELREFNLRKPHPTHTDVGLFFETDVKQTPANEHNGSALFAKYVNNKQAEILAGKHNVPHRFDGVRFRGGASENNIDSWDGPGIGNNEARHLVSVNTCNGCHGAETGTFSFLHVVPRDHSQPANLSGFLTGIDVTDPVDSATVRHMHDLDRRAVDLHSLVSSPVMSQLGFQPTSRTH